MLDVVVSQVVDVRLQQKDVLSSQSKEDFQKSTKEEFTFKSVFMYSDPDGKERSMTYKWAAEKAGKQALWWGKSWRGRNRTSRLRPLDDRLPDTVARGLTSFLELPIKDYFALLERCGRLSFLVACAEFEK